MIQRSGVWVMFSLIASLALAGCPPPVTTSPNVSSSGPSRQATLSDRPIRQSPEMRSSPRSLEGFRQGQTPGTPADSPLKEVYFDFDRFDIRPDARETLRSNAQWLGSNSSVRVEIEGHADDRGTNEYNLALGAKRAQSAMDYLVALGISSERLSTISYGEELPICREQNEACWQRNRRDRFVVLSSRPAS